MAEDIVFVTGNKHKAEEIRPLMPTRFNLLSLKDIHCYDDIPETADTLRGNAWLKASYVFEHFGKNCFADDTGLEIDALNGDPGVFSARYAGNDASHAENVSKVLDKIRGAKNRSARFRTFICLILDGRRYFFEGRVEGEILENPTGADGFGYDPIFRPTGNQMSFAEMTLREKNSISHRGRAMKKMLDFLV